MRIDFSTKRYYVVGLETMCLLRVWDTIQNIYLSVMKKHIRRMNAIVICYDITSIDSFLEVEEFMRYVESVCHDNIPRVLVAMKSDLDEERTVTEE